METIKTRLLAFLDYIEMPISRFEKRCSMGNGYVKKSVMKGIGQEKLNNIRAEFPELSIEWLLHGEGQMLNQQADNIAHTNSGTLTQIADTNADTANIRSGDTTHHTTNNHYAASQTTSPTDINQRLLDEIVAQRRVIEKSQEQIQTLLSIIESSQKE